MWSPTAAVPTVETLGSDADLVLFFVIGLLAGAHCLGMCGPLVSTYAERLTADRDPRRRDRLTVADVRQHGLFNLGRTVGYAAVGGALGLVGGLVAGATAITPVAAAIRGSVGIVVGSLIVAVGIGYLVRGTTVTGAGTALPLVGRGVRAVTGVLTARVDRLVGSPKIAVLGTMHAFLPCPILYPAYLYALVVGDPLRGALVLGVLGAGTVPALLAYGLAIGSISVGHRTTLHRAMGVVFVALGYLPLAHGLMLFGIALPYPNVPFYQPL
jgi:sulfite exporter TauE/SafE